MKNRSLYQTQYVIWNNLDLPDVKRDLEAYQLTSQVLNLLNIHEGTMPRFHQHYLKRSSAEREDYLEAMELLEYDILYGKQEVYGGVCRQMTSCGIRTRRSRFSRSAVIRYPWGWHGGCIPKIRSYFSRAGIFWRRKNGVPSGTSPHPWKSNACFAVLYSVS